MTARLATVILSDDALSGDGSESEPYRTILNIYTPDGQSIATYDHHTQAGRIFLNGWHAAMEKGAL